MAEGPARGTESAGADPAQRKPFAPPELYVYGDLAAVTQTIGRQGAPDGGKGGTKGTRL